MVEYLPPYSPDFNPIEQSFAYLRGWMRQHHKVAVAYAEKGQMADFIELAILEFQKEMDMQGPWRHVGLI